MPALWRRIEARRQEKYERLKIAAQKAAAVKEEAEEALRRRMEAGKAKPPVRLSKREMMLVAENHKAKKSRLVTAAAGAVKR